MKIIEKTKDEIARLAAEQFVQILEKKPDAVFGLAADEALAPLYKAVAELCGQGKISFKNAKAFVVGEFEGLEHDNKGSAHSFLTEKLFSHIDMAGENTHFPCTCAGEEELAKYDEAIAAAGGIDLMAVGIGRNGAIGFNEPATPFESYTHSQLLTDATKSSLAEAFGGTDNVPERGVTMGIKTITGAKAVLMIATGQEKADIIYKMVYGKTVTYVPASMLQLHLDMTLYLDADAAAKLNS